MKMTRLQEHAPAVYPGNSRASTGEFFAMYSRLPSELKEKAMREYLLQNSLAQHSVRIVVESLFLPAIKFELARGTPTFRSVRESDRAPSSFGKRSRSFHYFIKGAHGFIENDVRRTNLFIQFLESMTTVDSTLLILIKDKDAENVGLSLEDALRFFPEWLIGVSLPPREQKPVAASVSETTDAPEQEGDAEAETKVKKKPGPKPKVKESLPND